MAVPLSLSLTPAPCKSATGEWITNTQFVMKTITIQNLSGSKSIPEIAVISCAAAAVASRSHSASWN